MENLTAMLLSVSLLLCLLGSRADGNQACPGTENWTKLRFYVQDLVGGGHPTVWKVAQSNLTDVLPSAFGLVSVLDNLVTSGPEMDSGEVGRIQGVIGMSNLQEKALVMLLNVVFTRGKYKGSTLSVLGRNPLDEEVREVPVVGGTGAFRMARGYAVTRTCSVDEGHTHGVIQYDVVVSHFHQMEDGGGDDNVKLLDI